MDKIIILTEGSFDAIILKRALDLLYPHLSKAYTFMNFEISNAQGSTSYLTHYMKAFIGAGIKNRVIAIYDNDAAGKQAIISLKEIDLPKNFKAVTLPELDIAKNWLTLGPNGEVFMDINGMACSIELYLGKDILYYNGEYEKIIWKSYIDSLKTYQGEVINKRGIQHRFMQKVKVAERKGIKKEEWGDLDLILQMIFKLYI